MMTLNEQIYNLKQKGYSVSEVSERLETWENRHTNRKIKVVGSYQLSDNLNNYGLMMFTDNGESFSYSELCNYWDRI